MNSEFIATRLGLSEGKLGFVGTDTPVLLRIWHTGTSAVTSVVVTSATNIVLTSAEETITSTFASDTTLAAVAATINNSLNWHARVLDGLRTDASASAMKSATITASVLQNGVTVWDAVAKTSTAKQLAFCATYDRGVGTENTAKGLHRVEIRKAHYLATLGGAAAGNALIVVRKVVGGGPETVVKSALSVSAADTALVDYSTTATRPFLTAPEGYEFVVVLKDGTSLADATTNFLEVDYLKV